MGTDNRYITNIKKKKKKKKTQHEMRGWYREQKRKYREDVSIEHLKSKGNIVKHIGPALST
ncbi:hypothetical protein Hanom_Chr13g01233721 [Helianthus anomalus]